jgi:recombination protein RecT
MGLMDLAIGSGSILWGQSEIVHQQDVFEIHGFDKPPTHTRNPFATYGRGEIIGAYVVVKTKDGDYLTTAMPITEIYNIRARSAAYKKSQGPWVTDPGEMIKKTVIKRAYKMWPKTERLDAAIQYLNTEGGEGIVLDATVDTGFDLEAALKDVAEAATKEALDLAWAKHGALVTKAKDIEGYKTLKKACKDRKDVLEGKA